MTDKKKRLSLDTVLAGVALTRGAAKDYSVTVRACYAPPNSCALPRRDPKISSASIAAPWAASVLRMKHHVEAWSKGLRLESLRIGLCDDTQLDEAFVSLYEASQLPRRTGSSDERLPLEWQCDELIARLVREGKNPITL